MAQLYLPESWHPYNELLSFYVRWESWDKWGEGRSRQSGQPSGSTDYLYCCSRRHSGEQGMASEPAEQSFLSLSSSPCSAEFSQFKALREILYNGTELEFTYYTFKFTFKRHTSVQGKLCLYKARYLPERDSVVQLYWHPSAFCTGEALSFHGQWLFNLGAMEVLETASESAQNRSGNFWECSF